MKKIFNVAVAVLIMLSCSICSASEQLIEASGSYTMDSRLDETPASATARAREEAKRAAVEKAGVYIESYSKTVDSMLDTDEVRTIAARFLKIQNESSKVDTVGESQIKFTVTIKALVDDIDENVLRNMLHDKQKLEELVTKNKELQEKYDALNWEMAKYKGEFDGANEVQKIAIKKEVARNNERFSAVDALDRGNNFSLRKDYAQALTAYDTALRLDPQLAEAYNNRGIIKYECGQIYDAIEDYNKAIQLKSNYAAAYNNRGTAYAALGQFQNALSDLQNSLKFNNKSAAAHNNLGSVYLSQKNFNAAIEEYTQALQLNSSYVDAYYNRAIAYYGQGKFEKTLTDLKRAMSLKGNDAVIKSLYDRIIR